MRKEREKAKAGQRALIEFEGTYAVYTQAERETMRQLTREEMRFVHELKSTLDARFVDADIEDLLRLREAE